MFINRNVSKLKKTSIVAYSHKNMILIENASSFGAEWCAIPIESPRNVWNWLWYQVSSCIRVIKLIVSDGS